MGGASSAATFGRMRDQVLRTEAIAGAKAELAGDSLHDWLLALGKGRRELNGAAIDQFSK